MENFINDISFILPVRSGKYDHIDRKTNFYTTLNYLNTIFKSPNIIITEQGEYPEYIEDINNYNKYVFNKIDSEFIYKCKIINDAVKVTDTKFFIMNDCDCVISYDDYMKVYNMLLNEYDLVVCHNNHRYEIPKYKKHIVKSNKWNFSTTSELQYYGVGKEVGCIVAFNKNSFIECGMYNENFLDWGEEDVEIVDRFHVLERKICTKLNTNNFLYHMEHGYGKKNKKNKNSKYNDNLNESLKIRNMNKQELLEYISIWNWV